MCRTRTSAAGQLRSTPYRNDLEVHRRPWEVANCGVRDGVGACGRLTARAVHRMVKRTAAAPRTVNALLDLLQFLGPSSARFQAVIHSLSVRFMPKSSLSRLSKSGIWAAP